jgi:hypothetical protein
LSLHRLCDAAVLEDLFWGSSRILDQELQVSGFRSSNWDIKTACWAGPKNKFDKLNHTFTRISYSSRAFPRIYRFNVAIRMQSGGTFATRRKPYVTPILVTRLWKRDEWKSCFGV